MALTFGLEAALEVEAVCAAIWSDKLKITATTIRVMSNLQMLDGGKPSVADRVTGKIGGPFSDLRLGTIPGWSQI
jgi:hypothetical protein